MPSGVKILFCNCGYYDNIDSDVKEQVVGALSAAGVQYEVVQDLCGLAAKKDARLASWASADKLKIVACYSRAVRSLFASAGVELEAGKVEFLNMRSCGAEEIIESLLEGIVAANVQEHIEPEEKGDWVPWFPVIDYDRCKNCMQCLNFCLFSVYGLSEEGRVEVQKPDGCKTNCPACARICPSQAIIFPKYADSPINGDEVDESEQESVAGRAGGGDIYEILKQRSSSKKRFDKDRVSRKGTDVAKLMRELDIGPEVLASLSASEISQLKNKSEKKHSD